MKINTSTEKQDDEVIGHVSKLMQRCAPSIAHAYSGLRDRRELLIFLIVLFHDHAMVGPLAMIAAAYGELFPELEPNLRTPPYASA